MTQSAGAAEYTDSRSAEELDSPNKYPGYVTKQSDGKASVMLDLWTMQSTPLLPPFPNSLTVVVPDTVLSMSFNGNKQCT